MAPSIKDQLPILKALVKWFTKQDLVIDSLVFRLHHQATSFVILIGFAFIVIENYLDWKAITCHGKSKLDPFAHNYCWMHGTAYVRKHLQGIATGCYVDQSRLETPEDAPITAYYLWLPYLLSMLYVLAKLPHSLWKKFFENNLINSIIGGVGGEDRDVEKTELTLTKDSVTLTTISSLDDEKPEGEEEDAQENNKGGKKNKGGGGGQQNQGGGKKNKGNQNQKGGNQAPKTSPKTMANSFMEFEHRYSSYQRNFFFLETLNIFTLLLSFCLTHWILNYKFWNYGKEVVEYLTKYGQYEYTQGKRIHDPMCELFPTEVSCIIYVGAATGGTNTENFLCTLQNNLFNQKYFFVLWVWWVFVLAVSFLGFVYRLATLVSPDFAKYSVSRKCHNGNLDGVRITSGECFVLELIIDNLSNEPRKVRDLLREVRTKLSERTVTMTKGTRDRRADLEDGFRQDKPPGYNKMMEDQLTAPLATKTAPPIYKLS